MLSQIRHTVGTRIALLIGVLSLFTLLAGCAREEEGEQRVIKVGAVLPLTGPLATIGVPERNMLDLAIMHLNEDEDSRYRYVLVADDSKGQPNEGVTAANKLVNIDEVDVMFVSLTSVAKAIIPVAERIGVPVIANSLSTDLPSLGENVFRFFPSTTNETDVWLREIEEKGYDKVGYLYINSDFAVEEREILKEKLDQQGKTFFAESFEFPDKDFKTQLLKMKREGIDVLIISGLGLNYTTIIKQMNEGSLDVPILGDFDFGLALAKNAAMDTQEGLAFYDGVVFAMIDVDRDSEELKRISANYAENYSGNIMDESEAIFFYDAMMLIDNIVSDMGSFDKQALIREMSDTEIIRGLSGNFQISGRSADMPMRRAEFVNGEIVSGEVVPQ